MWVLINVCVKVVKMCVSELIEGYEVCVRVILETTSR